MSSSPTVRNQPSHRAWLADFFASIDRMDATAFAACFEPLAGSFRFANHPPLQGGEQIMQGANGIFSLLDGIRHEMLHHWVADAVVIVEGRVHYRRRSDGFRLSVPFMSLFEFAAESPGPIRSYRVFVDNHELFQASGPK